MDHSASWLNELIDKIYDSALSPKLWPTTLTAVNACFPEAGQPYFSLGQNDQIISNHPNDSLPKNKRPLHKALLQHLKRATIIERRHKDRRNNELSSDWLYAQLFDHLSLGIVFITPDHDIIFSNKAANTFLGSHGPLRKKGNKLTTLRAADAETLSTCVDLVRRKKQPSAYATELGDVTFLACLIPLTDRRKPPTQNLVGITLLISSNNSFALNNLELIQQAWKLTSLEADIAIRLMDGLSLKKIAGELEITHATAQWYSKQIMQKTRTRRQAELCIKLHRSPTSLIAGSGRLQKASKKGRLPKSVSPA